MHEEAGEEGLSDDLGGHVWWLRGAGVAALEATPDVARIVADWRPASQRRRLRGDPTARRGPIPLTGGPSLPYKEATSL